MTTWPTKKLGEVCEIYQSKTIASEQILKEGPYKVFGANSVIGYYDKYNHEDSEVLVTCRGATCGTVNLSEPKSWITGNAMVVHPKVNELSKMFLYYILKNSDLKCAITGAAQPQITRISLSPFRISLPSLKIQHKIVKRLDAISKAQELNNKQIALAEELFQSLLSRELKPREDWEIKKLRDVCEKIKQSHPRKSFRDKFRYIDISSIDSDLKIIQNTSMIKVDNAPSRARKLIKAKDVLFATTRPYLERIAFVSDDLDNSIASTGFCVIRANIKFAMPELLYFIAISRPFIKKVSVFQRGASYPAVSDGYVYKIKVYIPPLKIQQRIVQKLKMVQDYKKKLFKQKQKLQELFESCLDKAMKGELVK